MAIPGGKKRILEGFPISTDNQTSHRGAQIPGGRSVDLTRNIADPDYVHFSSDDSGMHVVSDTYRVDPATKKKTVLIVIGTLVGDPPELTMIRLLETGTSFNGQPAHPHLFFSPDTTKAFFNSDAIGRPQVYMVTGYRFP